MADRSQDEPEETSREILVPRPVAALGSLGSGWDEDFLRDLALADPRWAWTDPSPWPARFHAKELMEGLYEAMARGASGIGDGMAASLALGLFVGQLQFGALDAHPKRAFALASLLVPRDPPIALRIDRSVAEGIAGWDAMTLAERFGAAAAALGIDAEETLQKARLPLGQEADIHREGMERLGGEREAMLSARAQARALERCALPARAAPKRQAL